MNDLENGPNLQSDRESEARRQWRRATQVDQTGWYAFVTALAGIIVVLVVSLAWDWTADGRLAPVVLLLSGCGLFVLPIGSASSWISRKYFNDNAFPTHLAAVAISLIGVVSIFGWGLVIASRH